MVVNMRIGKQKPFPLAYSHGFSYIGLLIFIMLVGFVLAEVGAAWTDARNREREQELLKVGDHFRIAIGQYYNNTPSIVKQYPPSLQVLLRDDRFLTPKRYLRKIYADPTTGMQNWGILESNGGIMGVYSLSSKRPYKTGNFRPIYQSFEKRKEYSEWIFAYVPQVDTPSK